MTTFCPNCVTQMEVDESSLADVVCPRCGVVVRSAPTPTSAAGETVGWRTTSVALKTQFGILTVFLIATAAALGLIVLPAGDGSAWLCMGGLLLLVYFLSLCVCASAPDPTARRSALACVLTLVFGSFGVIGFAALDTGPNRIGPPPELVNSAIAVGVFTVYYSAFVFLMRFHATIARVFGNRRLRRQCYVYLFVSPIPFGVNFVFFWLSEPVFLFFPRRAPFDMPREAIVLMQSTFNFAVGWYAMILWRTFRTIDRGFVADPRDSKRTEMDEDDLSID